MLPLIKNLIWAAVFGLIVFGGVRCISFLQQDSL